MNRAKNRKLVVFLDYDGTLSPIVDNPDRAFMSAEVSNSCAREYFLHNFDLPVNVIQEVLFQMRCAVKRVAKYFPTAIISGRSRDKVDGESFPLWHLTTAISGLYYFYLE